MAMVQRANARIEQLRIGGHISTFASSATLYEVGFNHFFKGRGESGYDGDIIYYQGHASPGMYSRAFVEGRLGVENLENFRRELQDVPGLVQLSAPMVDAGLLGVSDRLHGFRSDHGHLPGPI
jgi:pyruvate dehydrogenase E1 component